MGSPAPLRRGICHSLRNRSILILLPHASHFHARGGCKVQLQSTLKDNIIDFPGILRKLAAVNYPGGICLEYVWVDWEGCNRTDNIAETLLLRKLLAERK